MKPFRTNSQERLVTAKKSETRLDSGKTVRDRNAISETLNELQKQSKTDIRKLHFRFASS